MASRASDRGGARTVRGRILTDGRLRDATLRMEDGRIADVGGPSRKADVDFGSRLILPGFVDTHVHFRDPGHPAKEDFTSGSTSAAFGGVTTVLDMPNTDPPVTTREAWQQKLGRARMRSVVDFGLFAGLAAREEDVANGIGLLDDAVALKVYLGSSTGDLIVEDASLVRRAIAAAASRGRTVAFHAESEACLRRHSTPPEGVRGFAAHYWQRPNACEREAIEGIAAMPRPAGARLHVCHVSTAEGLAALPPGATAEVAPHHVLLTKDDLERGGRLKMNPPLRPRADRDALLAALAAGRVHTASDHAPHTAEEKELDLDRCPAGVPGVETMAPLLLALAVDGKLPLARVADALTRMPAEAFGLRDKGALVPGSDADLVVVDIARVEPIRAGRLHSRVGWTPFEGLRAIFPDEVWLRGEPIVQDGALVAAPGRGRMVSTRANAGALPGRGRARATANER